MESIVTPVTQNPQTLLRSALANIAFSYFQMDRALTLTKSAQDIIRYINMEFYRRKYMVEHHNSVIKNYFFEKDYKAHPDHYPPLIQASAVLPENFSPLVPGMPIDQNLFIGYFRDFKTPAGIPFLNRFGRTIDNLSPLLDTLRILLGYITLHLPEGQPDHAQKKETIQKHFHDVEMLYTLWTMISESFTKAQADLTSHLKTGHIIALISGLNLYLTDLARYLTEQGFALIVIEGQPPILTILDKLTQQLNAAIPAMVVDLLAPAVETMHCRIDLTEGRLKLISESDTPDSALIRFLDGILNLFIKQSKMNNELPLTNTLTGGAKAIGEKSPTPAKKVIEPPIEDTLIDSAPYTALYQSLEKTMDMMRTDLSPDRNTKGEITNYRQGFDQFEVTPILREVSYDKVYLNGRLASGSPLDVRYRDDMIIDSTYWFYDRIRGILDAYHISREGISYHHAEEFVNDVRLLFIPSRNEYNEVRKYGSFQQFRINIRRIFSSGYIQNRYNSQIVQVSDLLDNARVILNQQDPEGIPVNGAGK